MGDDPFVPINVGNGPSANGNTNIHVSNIGKTGIIVIVMAVGLAIGLSIGALFIVTRDTAKAERESRMLQYYVLEMDAKLIAAGFKTDADSVAKKLKEKGQ